MWAEHLADLLPGWKLEKKGLRLIIELGSIASAVDAQKMRTTILGQQGVQVSAPVLPQFTLFGAFLGGAWDAGKGGRGWC